jgi:hypothetical protein
VTLADAAVGRVFGGLARLRDDRALHPHGIVACGTLRALGAASARGADLLGAAGEHAVVVRLSRGGGLPEPLPDVLGCALRVPDAYGPGEHQDFALASSLPAPVGRHALVPALGFPAPFYSSVLPYRIGGETRMVGAAVQRPAGRRGGLDAMAQAVREGRLRVTLSLASPLGRWDAVATVDLDALGSPDDARIRFNPWNTGGGIRPTGVLQRLRDPAYRSSQAASPGAD